MSELGREQGQSQLLPSVPTDKIETDYNAETEVDDSNSQSCRTEQNENENIQPGTVKFDYRKKVQQILYKMYFVFKEVAIMLFLAFTYAALTNDPPKVSKSPAAFPFFPRSSIITDWYRGQLGLAIDKARESDIAFVMFYAPWDAESQVVRQEFDLAARYMNKQITFAAVNCWQPGSECRRQYSKAYNWPVLIAYPSHGKGIQYKGPRTAAHIVKFLMTLSRPIIRLSSEEEIHGLLASYDAIIVSCVNALPGSLEYAVLYTAALRFLEKDPFQEVAFAVLTGSKTKCFGATIFPSLTLHMWNETLWYPNDGEWKPDALLVWILKHLHQVSMWITPSGSKSLTLSSYVQPGPALILFTPRNPLESFIDYYDLLHEVGLEYYNCNDKHRVVLNSLLIHTRRIENLIKYTYLEKTCPLKIKPDKSKSFPSVITYTLPQKWANNSCCLSSSFPKDSCSKCDAMRLLKERLPAQCKHFKGQEECIDVYQHGPIFRNENKKQDEDVKYDDVIFGKNFKTSMNNDECDIRLPKNLQKFWKYEKCRIANIAQNLYPKVFSESISDAQNIDNFSKGQNINGLACKTNASLTLIALDSINYYHFAERLGINLSTKKDRTTAVIVNEKMETHHVIEEPLNDLALREFIYNFTISNLPRSFNSLVSIKSNHTHIYPYQRNCKTRHSLEPCLIELNTETFLPTVMEQNKAVIVLYYSKQCSFCNGISYTLLTVSKMFSSINSMQFTRIDGDLNVLPWEFTMDSYPTIIFFPARRKSESRVFPSSLPVTVPNLVSFILANLDSSLKLHAMWTLCNQTKFEDEKQSCVASVRAENLSIIDHTLRVWRNTDLLTKTKLLYKLQQLRNLNLLLAHSPQNTEEIQKYMTRLHIAPFKDMHQIRVAEKKKNVHIKDEL